MPDEIEGVSGRWTFFTQIHRMGDAAERIASTIFSVDSAEEIKVGIGRLFDSKKKIGER